MRLMPQADILFRRADYENVVQFAFELGAWLVPSHLRTAGVVRIGKIDEYWNRVNDGEKLFHIQHQTFEVCPLEVRRVRSNEGEDRFYVMQRNGGPTVDLLGPYEFEELGRNRVGGGFISYYPSFWNTETQSNESAPVEQKRFYSALLRYLKSNAIKSPAGRRTYWVGRSVAAGFRDGLIALPEGWNVPLQIPAVPAVQ
jgi:hypothetical protein